ncbi:chemotaxis protein CheD [Thauera aromatica]|uniref:chemotaxis protein CheD n=1 Tax=Thauera aromatica TaxID=59405 RepID=UPI001FFD2F3A|nr:chemotaxis protein CheD [Thauera aromatica]MCK2095760.1 chemotaxis protein CheD [Thauera aromatica]
MGGGRHVIDIFLQPGDFYFGDCDTRIRTLLGSCVSITLWHPRLRHGGMCHYMLPARSRRGGQALDGRYADDAIALFLRELRAHGTRPGEYQVKLFGGGRMFRPPRNREGNESMEIGNRNIEAGQRLLRQHGFRIKASHLAGDGHRSLIFEVGSGEVWVRHVADSTLAPVPDGAATGAP